MTWRPSFGGLVAAIGGALSVLWLLRSPVLRVTTIEKLQSEVNSGA